MVLPDCDSHREGTGHLAYFTHVKYSEMSELQQRICHEHGREFVPCTAHSKLGLAIQTIGRTPINGLRHRPTADTNGWYIWAGEYSNEADFFLPLHAKHLVERLPDVIRFLGLPPGSRFLLNGDYADVWFDESLLIE
jgi:hypothetical protein